MHCHYTIAAAMMKRENEATRPPAMTRFTGKVALVTGGGGGAIVNVGSITGIRGTEAMVAYSASKSGVTALTASLALDHAGDNIRVNAIAGGDPHPHGRQHARASGGPGAGHGPAAGEAP